MENKTPIHVGKRLREYVTENRIFQANWARAQGIKPRTIARYLKSEHMKIATLFTICKVLKYNFIREIAGQLPADLPPHAPNPLEAEVDVLKKENERLREQIALLKEIMGVKIQGTRFISFRK